MPLPTCSVSLPVSERPFSAWSSPTGIHRSNVASDATRDAPLRAFEVANYHAHNDAIFAANFGAWSDALTGAIRLQSIMRTMLPTMLPTFVLRQSLRAMPTVCKPPCNHRAALNCTGSCQLKCPHNFVRV
jgi:hypothetical protein